MSTGDYLLLFIVSLVIILIGLSRRFRNENSYLVGERKTGFFALTATLVMTELNTATLISFASLGYIVGLWSLILPFIFLIGLLFYAVTVSKKWKKFNGLSTAQFFSERYGSDLGKLVSTASLIAMSGFSAAYVKSITVLFSPLFPTFTEWQLSALFVGLILLMTLRGGLISIIYTDTICFLITLIFFPMMAFYVYKSVACNLDFAFFSQELAPHLAKGEQTLTSSFVLSLIVLTMFTYILAPWYGQKIFSAKSERTAYLSVIVTSIIVFCLYELVVFVASFLHLDNVILSNPEQALPYILHHILPTGLCGLGYGILFAAGATTLTGVWNAMTSMVIGDFAQSSACGNRFRACLLTAVFASVSYLLANVFVDQIFNKMILANIPMAALSFSLLAGFYWDKASRFGAYLSIITGLSWGIFTYLWWGEEGEYTWYWAMAGIPLTAISGIVGSYCVPSSQPLRVYRT